MRQALLLGLSFNQLPRELVPIITASLLPFTRSHLGIQRLLQARSQRFGQQTTKWGRVDATEPNSIWQLDMTKVWVGPAVGWSHLA
jgi:hypothetical protein